MPDQLAVLLVTRPVGASPRVGLQNGFAVVEHKQAAPSAKQIEQQRELVVQTSGRICDLSCRQERDARPQQFREGGDPSAVRKSPGQTKYDAITLERGVTHDTEFERWANKIWNYGAGLGAEVSLKDFRKDIIIEVYNEAGQLAIAYKIYRCWVSEYQALPDLDANAKAITIQTIKLENEGWERDYTVGEPSEPSYSEP